MRRRLVGCGVPPGTDQDLSALSLWCVRALRWVSPGCVFAGRPSSCPYPVADRLVGWITTRSRGSPDGPALYLRPPLRTPVKRSPTPRENGGGFVGLA